MFWGRSAAIRPLLDLDLRFEDFAVEFGQIDGTLAHAVERTIFMFAERSGHEWLKVARRDLYPLQQTILDVNSMDDIRKARLKVFRPCLCGADASVRPAALGIQETRPLLPVSVAAFAAAPQFARSLRQSAAYFRRLEYGSGGLFQHCRRAGRGFRSPGRRD